MGDWCWAQHLSKDPRAGARHSLTSPGAHIGRRKVKAIQQLAVTELRMLWRRRLPPCTIQCEIKSRQKDRALRQACNGDQQIGGYAF